MVSTTCRCGTGARSVVSDHCVQLRSDGQALGQGNWAAATLARERQRILLRTRCTAYERSRARGLRTRGIGRRPAPRPGATGRRRARSICRKSSAGRAYDPTPTERATTREGAGDVDAASRPGRVWHARSGTEERRAYARLGRGPTPFRCATGRFDATSGVADLTMLAADGRFRERAARASCWIARCRSWRLVAIGL